MVTVQLKIVEEGFKHPIQQLVNAIADNLHEEDVQIADHAELELKIKFLTDSDQDLVLIQLREEANKHKINEKIIHYMDQTWVNDIAHEAHALLAGAAVSYWIISKGRISKPGIAGFFCDFETS